MVDTLRKSELFLPSSKDPASEIFLLGSSSDLTNSYRLYDSSTMS